MKNTTSPTDVSSLQHWLTIDVKSCTQINSVHLLNDDNDEFTVAINWPNNSAQYFKIFKQQKRETVNRFNDVITKDNAMWRQQTKAWLDKPLAPLTLKH